MADFAARFCQHYGITPEEYVEAMLRRCLHRRARPLAWLLRLADSDYFQPDFELIRNVGKLTWAHTWQEDAAEFQSHPKNARFLRRRLRLRVSVRRVTRLVNRLLPERKAGEVADAPPAKDDAPARGAAPLFGE